MNYNKTKAINIAQWIVVFGIFLNTTLELLAAFISFFILLIANGRIYKSKLIFFLLTGIAISLISTKLVDYNFSKPFQQISVVSLYILLYEQFFFYNEKKLKPLFSKYIWAVYVICIIGLIQEIIYIGTGGTNVMSLLPDYHATHLIGGKLLRISSILSEGGWLGTSLLPSIVYLFYYNDFFKILGRRRWIILFTSLFTVSPFVYASIAIIFASKIGGKYKILKKISIMVMIILCGIFLNSLVNSKNVHDDKSPINGIAMRINDTWNSINNINEKDINMILDYSSDDNISTKVLISNLYVAIHAPSRIIGTGIGTNAQNYQKVLGVKSDEELNMDDGYSLFNRIFSEFGIIGIVLYVFFVFHFFRKRNSINICFLIMICGIFIRGGSYIMYGTVFIHFMYCYSDKILNVNLKK